MERVTVFKITKLDPLQMTLKCLPFCPPSPFFVSIFLFGNPFTQNDKLY